MPGTSACAQRGTFFLLSLISVSVTASAAFGAGDDTQSKAAQPKDGLAVPPGVRKDPQPEAKRQAAAPDPRARLDAERRRISAAAAAAGTDPTAIIGYYQLSFGHNDFSRGLSSNAATAVVRLPLTPNWLVQVTLPYVWADLNGRRSFSVDGTSDLVLRTGGRLYASTDVALFAGLDASFPAASDRRLGTGKYTLGPGLGVAAPLPRLRSLSFLQVENFNSVGGDPSRVDLHYLQVQGGFNTLWSEHWWTLLTGTWDTDWNNRRRPTLNLVGQLGYRFDDHWTLFCWWRRGRCRAGHVPGAGLECSGRCSLGVRHTLAPGDFFRRAGWPSRWKLMMNVYHETCPGVPKGALPFSNQPINAA